MKYSLEIEHQGLLWINITKQEEKTLLSLQKRFAFDKQEIQESLPPFQRPKLIKRDGYYFIVLHFPVFDRTTGRLGFTEVDLFLNSSSLISIHDDTLPVISNFFNQCQKDPIARDKYFQGTAAQLFFELLSRLVDSTFPILLHVNEDINQVNKTLFIRIPDRKTAEEILRLKTNVVTFRRTMQGHKTVLDRLVSVAGRELDLQAYQHYINAVREHLNEIWRTLESQKESVDALHETNESVVSLRMNEIMKTLTIISVITFPLTLVATIFSISAADTPFIHQRFGFWIISAVVLIGALSMVVVFKIKKWMD